MKLGNAYIAECLTYDPQTGRLFWKERPKYHYPTRNCWFKTNGRKAGKEAGSRHFCRGLPHCVRIVITQNGKQHDIAAQNLAWVLMGLELPDGMVVDHKDGNPFNNKWDNLRLATIGQNAQNKVSNRNRKHPLPKGVYPSGKKYRASIFIDGRSCSLGVFQTAEEAHSAYTTAASEHFGEFARFN